MDRTVASGLSINGPDWVTSPLLSNRASTQGSSPTSKSPHSPPGVPPHDAAARTHEGVAVKLHYSPLHKQKPVVAQNGTIFSGVVNLTNTILGAGLLGLPCAVAHTGMVLGVVFFVIFAGLSSLGLHFSAAVARRVPDTSYYKIAGITFPRWKVVVDFAVAIKCFGVATSYLIVVGDLMPVAFKAVMHTDAFAYGICTDRRTWISVLTLLCVVPTSIRKNIDSLKFTSTIALICISYVIVVVMLIAFANTLDPCPDNKPDCEAPMNWNYPGNLKDLLSSLPIFVFGFTCHQNMFSVANELKNNTQRRLDLVTLITMGMCIVTYCLVSYAGYSTYGSKVESDVLKNFPDGAPVTVVRFVFSVNLALSFCLQCHPCRNSLSNILYQKNAYMIPDRQFYMLTGLIIVLSFSIAVILDDLGIVLGIVGATGSTIISYILPGAFYYKLQKTGKKRYLALALACLGCFVVPFALTMQFVADPAG